MRKKIYRNTSTEDDKEFWTSLGKSVEVVKDCPDWKKAGINVWQLGVGEMPDDSDPEISKLIDQLESELTKLESKKADVLHAFERKLLELDHLLVEVAQGKYKHTKDKLREWEMGVENADIAYISDLSNIEAIQIKILSVLVRRYSRGEDKALASSRLLRLKRDGKLNDT